MTSLFPAILIASLPVPFASAIGSTGTLFGPPQGGPHAAYEEGTSRYAYDRNGNLIRREEKTSGIVTRRYRFTTTGHLKKQDLTDHIYDAEGNKLASVLRDGTIVSYLHGTRFKQEARGEIPKVLLSFGDAELSEQQELQFFLTDHLSTVTAMANRSGLEEVKEHQPYGQVLFLKTDSLPSIERTEHDFTGNELQDEHLDYRARQMVPGEARFLQADPTIPNLQLPLAYNRYAYVYNNPVSFDDPTGNGPNPKNLGKIGQRLAEILESQRAKELMDAASNKASKEMEGTKPGEVKEDLLAGSRKKPNWNAHGYVNRLILKLHEQGGASYTQRILREKYGLDLSEGSIAERVIAARERYKPLAPRETGPRVEIKAMEAAASMDEVPHFPEGTFQRYMKPGDLTPEQRNYIVSLYEPSNATPEVAAKIFRQQQGYSLEGNFSITAVWRYWEKPVGADFYDPTYMRSLYDLTEGDASEATRLFNERYAPITRDQTVIYQRWQKMGLQGHGVWRDKE